MRRDPYAVPPAMPSSAVFKQPPHEWLRQASLAAPDWELLRWLTPRVPDWTYLLEGAAGHHRMHAIPAWRRLDRRLADVSPPSLVEGDQKLLADLDALGAPYWEQVCGFGALLDRMGIRYVAYGGPGQYLPLGVDHWPRHWTDCDLDVEVTSEDDLAKIAEAAGAQVVHHCAGWWDLRLPGGVVISLGSLLPSEDDIGRSWTPFAFPTRRVSVLGGEIIIPHPVPYVMRFASFTPNAVMNMAAPMPLWDLGRCKAWIEQPEWDWQAFSDMLRRDVEWTESSRLTSPTWELHRRNGAAQRALWTLRMMGRVYPGSMQGHTSEELIAPHAVLEPCPESPNCDPSGPVGSEYVMRWLEWDQYPGDEAFLFDKRFDRGIDERIAARLWKPYPGKAPERFRLGPGGHHVKIEEVGK